MEKDHEKATAATSKSKKNIIKTDDSELEDLLKSHRTNIKVIGTGGAGNNTLSRLSEVGVKGIDTIAINTDAQDLLFTKADNKLLIGRNRTNGLGAGSNPQIGEESALENQEDIKSFIEGSDMVFVTCGLGGGTGSGSAPVIAELAKSVGALTIAVTTLPFTEEGVLRWDNAIEGLEKLRKNADTVIVVQNDRLLDIVPDLPLNAAFKIADEILVNAVKGITELVTEKGLVNLDFADVRAIMHDGDTAMIGIGESSSENKAIEAVEKAVMNPLLDVDITGAKSALINISGDSNMTILEAKKVMNAVAEKLDPEARIIWGARIDDQLSGVIRVLIIATGLRSTESTHRRKDKKVIKSAPVKVTPPEKPKNSAPPPKEKDELFDIKENKSIKFMPELTNTNDNQSKMEKKTKKVFTEIFEEEIRGDLNIIKEAIRDLNTKNFDEKILRNILNACSAMQSSAQLFNYEKIEEFTLFIADVIEGVLSNDIEFSDEIVILFKKIPTIIEGIISNNKVVLPEVQKFIEELTKIIDDGSSNKKKIQSNIASDKLVVGNEDLKNKLKMELN